MNFEYDPGKSKLNAEKHGITLEVAKQLWLVPSIVIQARTVDESRWMKIGFLKIGYLKNKCYSCIFTLRGDIIRLISARRSHPNEERLYHDHFSEESKKN